MCKTHKFNIKHRKHELRDDDSTMMVLNFKAFLRSTCGSCQGQAARPEQAWLTDVWLMPRQSVSKTASLCH